MWNFIPAPYRLAAGVAVAAVALAASFAAGWNVNGSRWEAKFNAKEAEYANARADADREARKVLEEAVLIERAEQRRLEDEASAAILKAEERAKGLADRLGKTQAALAAAIRDDPSCSAQASQPLACPHSWAAAHP